MELSHYVSANQFPDGLTAHLLAADRYRLPDESHIDAYLSSPFSPWAQGEPRRSQIEQYAAQRASEAAAVGTPQFRAHAPMPLHAEELIDREIGQVRLERLSIVAKFITAGLTYPLPNWLAIMNLITQQASKSGAVRRVMNPEGRGYNSMQDLTYTGLPIFATVGDFNLGLRDLLESQRAGMPLDVANAAQIVRRMNESFEDTAIFGFADEAGNPLSIDGKVVPGLLNAPGVNYYQYLAGAGTGNPRAWDDPLKTGFEIIDGDLQAMISVLQSKRAYGPYCLFVPTTYGNAINRPYNPPYASASIAQRLAEYKTGAFTGIEVVVADRLPANRVVLMDMHKETARMIIGQQPTAVSWTSESGFSYNSLIVGCMVPQYRTDYDGQSGILVGDIITH